MLKYSSDSCFADFRSLHFLMEDALELIEREVGRLTRHLQAVELQRLAQSSSWWWKQVQEAKGSSATHSMTHCMTHGNTK